ncbi:hypothetical protein JYU34_020923 [Plutella xylostella]|uniref:Uncharacterized protein n=1 Tax=Plutella xylostella TaxID=51655 RepID=A0ABQ7PS89_PLUXY|nr:hypothetical protein JYU34_020923 [Plutella xylostella]
MRMYNAHLNSLLLGAEIELLSDYIVGCIVGRPSTARVRGELAAIAKSAFKVGA